MARETQAEDGYVALVPDGLARLKDKVCVVTGAASSLAEVVADRLASEGATVVGVDRREHSVGAHARQADLTDEDQVRKPLRASGATSDPSTSSTTTPG